MLTLILGGARSGKSRFAETQARQCGLPVYYIATAEAGDEEMAARIARHKAERSTHWTTIEAPLNFTAAITNNPDTCILVDCLTLWLSNWLCRNDPPGFQTARHDLMECLATCKETPERNVILVSNEVGLGIIPLGELTRQFVDESGRMNQDIAAIADEVVFLAAGLPLSLKTKHKERTT